MNCFKSLQRLKKDELIARIENALVRAFATGQIDGSHHKMWTIDQMIRCLTGCPYNELEDSCELSSEYERFIEEYCGDDYDWEIGKAP